MKGRIPTEYEDFCWAYYPEKDICFYRVFWLSNVMKNSENHQEFWQLLIEINENSLDKLD